MKKALALCLTLLLCLALLPGIAAGDEQTYKSGDYRYTLSPDGTAKITGYFGKASSLEIPENLDGYAVTSIGDFAFSSCKSLELITIPDNVTTIGINPFRFCISLKTIVISPNHPTLATIDGVLFYKPEKRLVCCPCTFKTRSYSIPNGVSSIGDWAFSNCFALISVTIPDSVTSIDAFAFYECSSLASVTIPDGINSLGNGAFAICTSLSTIIIPDSVTSIRNDTFFYCTSLTSVTIPDSVTSIGKEVFDNCKKLILTVPAGSYAEQYAKDNSIPYTYPNGNTDWLLG